MKLDHFYINGEFVKPSTTEFMDVINPYTEESIASVALGAAEDVDKAVAAARDAFAVTSAFSKEDKMEDTGGRRPDCCRAEPPQNRLEGAGKLSF